MAESLSDQIMEKIGQAAAQYHRLILVVAPSHGGKTPALKEVGNRTNAPMVNVNLELSRRMLDLAERQRALQVQSLLKEIIGQSGGEVVLLDNIEVIFHVGLQQDPLRLLQQISRNKTVVAAWNGDIVENHLIYAAPDHSEYRRYPMGDFLVVSPKMTS